ncbi:hypothetical protein BOTNAR_0105g00130 [Botryotinia narcissicola]|uniref:Uncharacterized protein n=1 Tax=Botryotinia narcissicola TaxID=278944 RepID=A0A4Z1J1L3_9HELO|nr:hypothetical protein BOTNAR_0105g00130 [Botryotinia narcissicola]
MPQCWEVCPLMIDELALLTSITIGALSFRSSNRARNKAPFASAQENAMLEHDSVASTNARDSRPAQGS